MLQTRQPWADVVAEPARPTAEQEEWLKAEGFREEQEEQPDEDAEDGPPKVSQHVLAMTSAHLQITQRALQFDQVI